MVYNSTVTLVLLPMWALFINSDASYDFFLGFYERWLFINLMAWFIEDLILWDFWTGSYYNDDDDWVERFSKKQT